MTGALCQKVIYIGKCQITEVLINDKDRSEYLQLTALDGALDNCLWFLLPEEFFADLMNKVVLWRSGECVGLGSWRCEFDPWSYIL